MPNITCKNRFSLFLALKIALLLSANPLLAQPPTLPFHLAWREYPFADSFGHLQELELLEVAEGKTQWDAKITQFHWVRFDSLGRAVDELFLHPPDAHLGRSHRIHWVYDSTGCPERHVLVGGTYIAYPSNRYDCKDGRIVRERRTRQRSFVVVDYAYEFFQAKPSHAIVYKGSSGGVREVMDTIHYRYDSLHRLLSYHSDKEELRVVCREDCEAVLEEADGTVMTTQYYPTEFGIPLEVRILRRDGRHKRRTEFRTLRFRPLFR